jgi:GDP-4-dehydro-6-deoxy-D-mannose reductase
MRVLVTGIAGFAGSHLALYLDSLESVQVAGIDLNEPPQSFTNLFPGGPPTVYDCDLADDFGVTAIVEQEEPDAVIHLAARAQVAGAWEMGADILRTNIGCTQTLLRSIQKAAPSARVLLISSSEVYGKVLPEELPLDESAPLRPNNPYSVSKVSQEFLGKAYMDAFGMEVVIARPFNHIGPRQVGNFVVATFARQLAEIEAGLAEPVLRVGNLESKRDFTDVRDIVRAYYLILTRGETGEAYNVASGRSHAISDILKRLLDLSGADPEIETIPELMRPSDTPDVRGDCRKLVSLGEWEPAIPLEQSLEDALDYWRGVAKAKI